MNLYHQQRSDQQQQQLLLQQQQQQFQNAQAAAYKQESQQDTSRSSLHQQPSYRDQRQQQQVDQEMWVQKMSYQDQRVQQQEFLQQQQQQQAQQHQQQQQQHYGSDLLAKHRRANNNDHQQQNHGSGNNKGMAIELHNTTTTAAGSQRHGSAKHAALQQNQDKGGFFSAMHQQRVDQNFHNGGEADNIAMYLNKTQVIQSNSGGGMADSKTSNDERANRINLHRSNRQRSHQAQDPGNTNHQHHQQHQHQQQQQYYEQRVSHGGGASKGNGQINGHSGMPEVKIELKNKGSDLDAVNYSGQYPDSVKNSANQLYRLYQAEATSGEHDDMSDQFYQTQKIEGTGFSIVNQNTNFKQQSQQSSNAKSHQYQQQQQYYHDPDNTSLNDSKQHVQQQNNNMMASKGVHNGGNGGGHQSRRGSEANSHGKKKVQPPQPRNREESTSRRSGAAGIKNHNKSSETTNSQDQSSQNSSQGLQQPQQQINYQSQQQPQSHQIDSSKFSQLVCQVPQGSNTPQMSNQSNAIQVQDSQSANFQNQYLLGPQRASESGRKTLVLDLDETLVHSSFKPVESADIMLQVEIEGQICTIYVLVRPFVAQFLKRMHKMYELVIFTASLSKYAEPLMQHLDPQKMCSYLLFREHCTFFNNAYVKDLTRLGRPMKDVIIVDNSPVAYLFQPENAIPAVNWYDDPTDTELNRIAALLERLNHEDDVRKIIRTVISNNKIDPRQEQIYLASAQHRRDKSQRVDRRAKPKLTGSGHQHQHQEAHSTQQPVVSIQKVHSQQHDPQQASESSIRAAQQPAKAQSYKSAHQAPNASSSANAQQQPHSRYDSSDTRHRNAALISEEINQRKRGGQDNLNLEMVVLSNVQKLSNQSSDLQYQTDLKKSMHQNQNDIQQAYQHHKNQILQLKNEIAALKSQQTGKSPRNDEAQQQIEVVMSAQQRRSGPHTSNQPSSTTSKGHSKTTQQVQRAVHQQIGDTSQVSETIKSSPVKTGNKGSKPRESSRRQAQEQENPAAGNQRTKPQSSNGQKQQRQSYKMLSANEIQLVNYLKSSNRNGNGTGGANAGAGSSNQQRHSINVDKKQLVVRESLGNNSQLHNTKQIIKLIKKSEGHQSNYDVTGGTRQSFQPIEAGVTTQQPQSSQQNIQGSSQANGSNYNRQQMHPATTKSQTKQHFAFAAQGQSQGQPQGQHIVTQDTSQRQVRQSQQNSQPFSGQINMISSAGPNSRGQQASRTSSKTTKNYSTSANTAAAGNIRTSHSSSKHGAHLKVAQTSLQTHERMSASGVVGSSNQTKRSSSVKTSSQSHHVVHKKSSDKEHLQGGSSSHHAHRKGNNSATHQNNSGAPAYSNLASYDIGHRRERGNSAQPNYAGGSNHGPSVNPILVTNIVSRSSSTTNKNKKVNSISGAGNFHNLVLAGSHSTKHSTQQAHHPGHQPTTQSILQANSHANQQRGGSQDRHQQKTSSSSRQPTRIKSAKGQSHTTGSESKDDHHHKASKQSSHQQQFTLKQQQEHLQRMQQLQQNAGPSHQVVNQLSVTQKISPGTMLNLAQYQPASVGQNSQQQLQSSLTPSNHQQQAQAIVKQNLKDIQVQDMLKLTQGNAVGAQGYFGTGMSSTRNQKQGTSGHHSVQQQETDDFLKKVKLQQQSVKNSKDQLSDMQRRNTDKPGKQSMGAGGGITIMHQEGAISKSSQGHVSMGPGVVGGLTINSPKYNTGSGQTGPSTSGQGSTRDQQKILNDIMNMSSMQREQKSGSAATSYATKQVHMTSSGGPTTGSNGHQIKKIRISTTQQSNGRISGQSNQSAPNHHKSSGLKRGDSNHSRGSHSSAIHQVIRTSASGATKSRDQARQAQLFNQTMKLKDTNARAGASGGGGILSLLGDLGTNTDSQEKDLKNQTAADIFLKSHNEEQFSQTQYFGANTGGTHLGNNQQLREVTRHFYNQLSSQGGGGAGGGSKKQQHTQQQQQ